MNVCPERVDFAYNYGLWLKFFKWNSVDSGGILMEGTVKGVTCERVFSYLYIL